MFQEQTFHATHVVSLGNDSELSYICIMIEIDSYFVRSESIFTGQINLLSSRCCSSAHTPRQSVTIQASDKGVWKAAYCSHRSPGPASYPNDWPHVLYLAHVLYSIRDLTGNDNPAAGWKLACVDHIGAMKLLYRLSNGGRSEKKSRPNRGHRRTEWPGEGTTIGKSFISAPRQDYSSQVAHTRLQLLL